MESMTLIEITTAVDGRLLTGNPDTIVLAVGIDSRTVSAGELYIPIIGKRFNGHAFIEQAAAAGIAAVVASEGSPEDLPEDVRKSIAWIQVENTTVALQDLSAHYRMKFSMPLIGITGSVGKTSTKEMVADALSVSYEVLRTHGNFNNEIGLPQTLFKLDASHTAAVVEMGAGGPGDISLLTRLAQPTMAVVTNIGVSHIENFITRENILEEKLRIIEGFSGQDGMLFLNGDDELLASMRETLTVPTVWFGSVEGCDYRAEAVSVEDGRTVFELVHPSGRIRIELPVSGMHHVRNALAAAAVADHLGIPPAQSAQGMRKYKGVALRQQIREGRGLRVIDDSYNASPDSVRSGLDVLVSMNVTGRKIAVLADMYELGGFAREAHLEAGREAVRVGIDELVAVGRMSDWIREGALEERIGDTMPVHAFGTLHEAYDHLFATATDGDGILVKGSRGMHGDRLARALVTGDRNELDE